MGTLSKDKLIEYIRHAIDLESAVVTQEFIKREYVNISQANKPKLPEISSPIKYNDEELPVLGFEWGLLSLLLMLVGFGFSIALLVSGGGYVGAIIMAGVGILGLYIIIIHRRDVKEIKDKNARNSKMYERKMSDYEKTKSTNEQQYRDSMTLWQASDTEALAFIDEHLNQAHSDADKYYARNVIFEKYRNLPALTSIYEYLLSGRCEGLEGPNGAYNIYEMEVRQNTVISQLNVIIENLEQIKQNQYILYGELVKISNETSAITAEMRRISRYTYSLVQLSSLNAYYSAAAASAASAMAFDMALR